MITLDRAIELMEAQVGELSGVTGVVLYADDILHYLRELKLFRQTPIMQGIHKAQKECALYPVDNWEEDEPDSNPALTWDELKQMEGKPVWVEEPYAKVWHGEWKVVDMLYDGDYWDEDEKEFLTTDEERYHKTEQGKTWKAFRKERG